MGMNFLKKNIYVTPLQFLPLFPILLLGLSGGSSSPP